MKFLIRMIFCCATPSSSLPVIRHRNFTPRQRRTEETRALMRQSSAVSERIITSSSSSSSSSSTLMRRSSRGGGGRLSGIGSRSLSATQWKPSLCAISEDRVVYVVAGNGGGGGERTPTMEKKLAGKSSVQRSKIRVRDFNDNDFIRRAPAMNIIPAFSPTVFLF